MPPSIKSKSSGLSISSLIREAGQKAVQIQQSADPVPDLLGEITGAPSYIPAPIRPRIYSILDYIESSWGLGMRLYPVQRFIVKLYYHLPLNDRDKTIRITDMFNTKVAYNFTETEYLKYLFDEGRCNIGEQDHERRELILAIGRRAGKTTLSGIFASYEVYRLLNLSHPQGYYGLPPGNRIQIVSIATDKDQAGLLFNEVTSHLSRCEYFKTYIANNTLSYIQFRTPHDIGKYGSTVRHENGKFTSFNGKATLRVTFKSCIAKGLRGSGNIVVILDEMAHFKDEGGSSAKEIYDAVTPSTAAFSPKNPANTAEPIGPVEARVICISSPLNKAGKFYELFNLAMGRGEGSTNMIAIQAPTWEMNPTIEANYYRQKYHADPAVFMTEHGAQFSDRVRGWIEREVDLLACIDAGHRPQDIGMPRYPHHMGIDVGLIGDGTCIFITHCEGDKVVLDYHESWYAGVDWRDSNPHLAGKYSTDYARRLQDVERLDFEAISEWIVALTKRFYIADGIFDRWNGIPLEQALNKAGLNQFRAEFFTRDLSSRIYQNAKLMMFDEKLKLYDYPIPTGPQHKHSPFIREVLQLQAEQVSRNVVVVTAPEASGNHDDMSDAFVRSVWLASQHLVSGKHVMGAGGSQGGRTATSPMTLSRYQTVRARRHGGYGDRTVPRGAGGNRLRSR